MCADTMSYEDHYLQALLAQPAVSTITLADGAAVAVEQVYLPRTLSHEVVQKQTERESGAKPFAPEREITVKLPVELWPKLREERVVVVEGPAGMGKSTLTKQLVRESYSQHHLIPIWIPFRAFVASDVSIAEYLEQHYAPWLGLTGLRIPYAATGEGPDRSLGQWCYEQWQSGLGVLILDGLDEVFRHDERVTALRGLPIAGTQATRPATILTSRPLSQSLPLQMVKVEVQGLTPSDQIQLIERYRTSLGLTDEQVTHFTTATKKQEQGRLRELLTRPGHLIQTLTTYARTHILLNTETAILHELLQGRLTIIGRSRPPVEGDDAEKKRLVLASLALHLLACRQGQRHTRAQLLALIQQVLREHATHHTPLFPLVQATALLNDLTRNCALLAEVEPEIYEFETVIWLQYFTGTALADQKTTATLNLTDTQVLEFLDKKVWDPEWEPVLMSWVSASDDPFPLFTRLMEKEKDDLARHRLGTAGRCVREVSAGSDQVAVHQLRDQVAMEAFERWKIEAERRTEKLIETSLRGAWVETVVCQDELLVLLENSTEGLYLPAIEALSDLKQSMPDTVQEALVGRLKDPIVRDEVSKGLGGVGPFISEIVQDTLIGRLMDGYEDEAVQNAAVKMLSQLGAMMPESVQSMLVAQLKQKSWKARKLAVEVLSSMRSSMPGSVQQALVELLEDKEWEVRKVSLEALCNLGTAMSESMQHLLVGRLQFLAGKVGAVRQIEEEPLSRWQQLHSKRMFGSFWPDEEKDELRTMGKAFGGLGSMMAISVRHVLMERLTDPNGNMRRVAVTALGGLGTAMPVTVEEALVLRLADSEEKVREATVDVLGRLGSAMSACVQKALMERLADSDEDVRLAAVFALGMQDVKLATSVQMALVAQLRDPYWFVREVVVQSLGRTGAAMLEPVQGKLVELLAYSDDDWDLRLSAIDALGGLASSMSETVQQALVGLLEDEWESLREAAVTALGGLTMTMPESVQQVLVAQLELTSSSNVFIRQVLAQLGRLEKAMPKLVQQALMGMLVNEHPTVAGSAIRALGKLGSAMPEPVQQALMVRRMDPEVEIRRAADEALCTAQQQGIRFFSHGAAWIPGRLVSDLSATAPLADGCSTTFPKSSFSLAC